MIYSDFDDIRPFTEKEIPAAMKRLAANPLLKPVADYLYPEVNFQEFQNKIRTIQNTYDFQHQIISESIYRILEKSDSTIHFEGFENLSHNNSYLFISNHRDIVLDSAFLQIGLDKFGLKTSEITFGSNLMKPDFVVDFGKANKMFRVVRANSSREFLTHSLHLSKYIKYTLSEKRESIWIAQRNGRTKDGNDRTEPALLKMLTMFIDSKCNFVEEITKLNIVPAVISYEFEPCDALKTRELFLSSKAPYIKELNEDLSSILTGIIQKKGRITLKILPQINDIISSISFSNKNDFLKVLALKIDKQIQNNYELFPNNYIAWDLLNKCSRFQDYYTVEEKVQFYEYFHYQIAAIEGDKEEIEKLFLAIYSNPVTNCNLF